MSKIILKEMEFQAYHGYHAEEGLVGHIFKVDVEIDADIENAASSDKLKETVDYQVVYNLVAEEMAKPSKLIENLAHRVKTSVLKKYPMIDTMLVRISKVNPPVGGKINCAIVEL